MSQPKYKTMQKRFANAKNLAIKTANQAQEELTLSKMRALRLFALMNPIDTFGKELEDIQKREKHPSDNNFCLNRLPDRTHALIGIKIWKKSPKELFWLIESALINDKYIIPIADYLPFHKAKILTYMRYALDQTPKMITERVKAPIGQIEKLKEVKLGGLYTRWLLPLTQQEKQSLRR